MATNESPLPPAEMRNTTAPRFSPVTGVQRLTSVDVLRGFALLGILVINIEFFALPNAIYITPPIAGGFSGLNLLTWKASYVIFLEKFMSIFSMLFGAGLVLMSERAASAGKSIAGLYYRRVLWLLVFGVAHGYLLWYGDILYSYAVAGLMLYPLRRKSPRFLVIAGVVVLMFGGLMQTGSGIFFEMLRRQAQAVEALRAEGEVPTPQQQKMAEAWTQIAADFSHPPEKVAEEIAAYQGGYPRIVSFRAPLTLMMQTRAMLFLVLWRALGLMLLGMGLMKSGMFSAGRSIRFYMTWVIIGYGIGLPLCGYGMTTLIGHNFDFIYRYKIGGLFNHAGSVLVALAHASMVMIVYRKQVLTWLTRRLAAVGQTALSNYIMHSIICTTIFYGYGLGLFGKIERFALLGFVAAIWVLQLAIAPLWVKRFRFGPLEWLWRSLTYWRMQPFKLNTPGG